ncbi:alanine--tRNA ligase [candidate division WWE3 bacterium]|uniref:Alanine--tRNA ligase n=1 Tax=candidate division WWE3 bacterium TaxID=2053526 RepID=A0A955RPA4_UNCKA|nr:alanine--tRNA ligase [candidate division WWE3 bacterium]
MLQIEPWDFVQKYLDFFKEREHAILPNVNLVPKEDPTTLFINSGVQPIEKYLAGESHPLGSRLASVQRCIRTNDLEGPAHDSVGDSIHHVLFHMLGNWSLGDYFKKETLTWSYEFLVNELGIDANRLWVTIFSGNEDAEFDQEAKETWLKLGIPEERIIPLGKEDNWWGPAGKTGPCGPDSEIFFDRLPERGINGETPGEEYKHTERFNEVWNNVFSQYFKDGQGVLTELEQKNVDTGMGLERTIATLQGYSDNYQTKLFMPIIEKIESMSGQSYPRQTPGEFTPLPLTDEVRAFRIMADHIRSSVFMAMDGVIPSNKEQGYVMRRVIRRLIRYGRRLGIDSDSVEPLADVVIEHYHQQYPEMKAHYDDIMSVLKKEEKSFTKNLNRGIRELEKVSDEVANKQSVTINDEALSLGAFAFYMFETFGFPPEVTYEEWQKSSVAVDREKFDEDLLLAKRSHQDQSRTASAGKYAGGLADHSEETTKLHTATHLLHKALRTVLGDHVQQMGSNITQERLRFDFSHTEKLTDEEIQKVEQMVNEQIKNDLPVTQKTMPKDEALNKGALAFFQEKYPDTVSVYIVGDDPDNGTPYSMELCGGPHVTHTGDMGTFKIIKQENIGKGTRRIKATLS